MARSRAEEQRRANEAINEFDQILRQDNKEQLAAKTIQKAIRSKNARKKKWLIINNTKCI